MEKKALILLITACFASKAIALECGVIVGNNLNYEEKESVGEILIPKNGKIGEIIWKSNPIRKKIQCKSDIVENVYFYPFPKRPGDPGITIPKGMTFGITYRGNDTDLNPGDNSNANAKDTGIKVNSDTVESSIEFQLYIRKTGEIKPNGSDLTLPIVQLDGVRGINATGGRNYRYNLSSLNNISDVECSFQYQRKPFNIKINNDLTLKQQKVLIGNYIATCSPDNKIAGHTIVYSIPDKSKEYSTELEKLNYHLDVNNSIKLDNKGKSTIDVNALFKLDYNDQDWLYDTNTKINMPNVTIIPQLQRIN